MRKIKFLSVFMAIVFLTSMASVPAPVYADDSKPLATPIPVRPPEGVTVTVEESTTTVQGPDGQE